MKKNRRYLKQLLQYARSHYVFRNIIVSISLLSLITVIFYAYIQQQYINFLYDSVRDNNSSILEIEQEYIGSEIRTALQSGSNYSLDTTLRNLANAYVENPDDIELNLSLAQQLQYIAKQEVHLIDVAVADKDGNMMKQNNKVYMNITNHAYWNSSNKGALKELCEDLNRQIEQNSAPRYVISSYPNRYRVVSNHVEVTNYGYIANFAFALRNDDSVSSDYDAILVLSYQLQNVRKYVERINHEDSRFSTAVVTDENSTVLYSENDSQFGKKLSDIYSEADTEILTETLSNPEWNINIIIDKAEMRAYVRSIYLKGILFFFLVILLITFIQFMQLRLGTKPIRYIQKAMDSVKDGNLGTRIEIHGEDELWQLAKNYNKMVDSLVEQREDSERKNREKIELVKRAGKAEMKALQLQIDAHFLVNTLNAINYSALDEGNEDVSEMLTKLSNIMRYVYSNNDENITLKEEILWVDQYLALQKFRLMDAFSYQIEYPEIYSEWPCCKLFLQPFVENAIKHGFAEKEDIGIIRLKITAEGARLKVVIADNGCGMTTERKNQVIELMENSEMKNSSVGLQNVAARMRLFYGSQFEIYLNTSEGNGTEFTMYLPIPENIQS